MIDPSPSQEFGVAPALQRPTGICCSPGLDAVVRTLALVPDPDEVQNFGDHELQFVKVSLGAGMGNPVTRWRLFHDRAQALLVRCNARGLHGVPPGAFGQRVAPIAPDDDRKPEGVGHALSFGDAFATRQRKEAKPESLRKPYLGTNKIARRSSRSRGRA
jgi:hypothetical protein